jgi:hypothetical protein
VKDTAEEMHLARGGGNERTDCKIQQEVGTNCENNLSKVICKMKIDKGWESFSLRDHLPSCFVF